MLVISGAACLSASAVFVKLADIDAGTAAFLRCAIALVPLVPMLLFEARRNRALPWRLQAWSALAGVFLGIDYVMWTVSILDVGAAISTVLINVQVLAFPLLARIFSGTQIPRRFLHLSPLMLGGLAMAGGALSGSQQAVNPVRGTVLGIAAGVAYAVYLYLTRLAGERSPHHFVTPVCVSTASAAVTSGAIGLLVTGLPLDIPAASWGWIAALALLGQVVAWLLIGRGTSRLAPNASAALLLLQPVMAIGLGMLVLRETPTASQLTGCALVVGAIWFANRTRARLPRVRSRSAARCARGTWRHRRARAPGVRHLG
ncbi:drug/metabolite transporter (DMT)-like permease [Saccharopolyspora spinosa]|uniref:Drug/metabolite transporter (DMT)-like permease n=1 Tax=Saccharopolyspora spinosa TaxID=60894 RepID=A0A2N3Y8H1_SACSN|nr:drug/metabolite transporter (DMT)-like permease [Saccharopolyspora spinosa]